MSSHQYELKILQDSFLRERIYGYRELPEEKIRERMEHLNLRLPGPLYCVVLYAPYLFEKEAGEIDLLLLKMKNTVRERYTKAKITCYTVSDTYCNVVGVLSVSSKDEYWNIIRLTQRIAHELIHHYDVNMYVGVGETVDQLSQLNRSKDTAAEALAHKFNFSDEHVITAKDVKRYHNHGDLELKTHYDRILGCFYDGNLELLEIRLRSLFSAVQNASADALNSVRNICIELTATLLRVVQDMGITGSLEMSSIYTNIAQMNSIPEISEWFLNYCAGMMQKVSELRKDKTQQIIEQAEKYIAANLGNPDLTLQSVSDHVNLSVPYFSSIFYKATGFHISEYINRIRIKEAQKQLLETSKKVTVIAADLGFSSPSYFNSVFKRYTGTTPSRFRERK